MSIQGSHPSNWLYWTNHPSDGNQANAEFKTVEGASERFIRKGEEIFAHYA